MPDERITMLDLLHDGLREIASASHVAKKLRDFINAIRTAMRQQQHRPGLILLRQNSLDRLCCAACGKFVHHLKQGLYVFDRSLRNNAVAQIKNVSRSSARALKDIFYA